MNTAVAPYRFTVRDFDRMGESGIFAHDARVELIEGEIVEMTPIGARHAACVKRLNNLIGRLVGERGILGVQDPVILGELSEPQPDVVLLRARDDFYASAHPGPEDILLLVEVADTSLAYDRGTKIPIYARYGVPEVWLVDLRAESVEIHRAPGSSGYDEVAVRRRGEELRLPGFDESLGLSVDAILGADSGGEAAGRSRE